MSNLQCIAEHTVDLSLIKRDSKVLDLGCRAFSWSKAMLEYVDKVCAVEADPNVWVNDERIHLVNVAIWKDEATPMAYRMFGNGTGNHILPTALVPLGKQHQYITITTRTLKSVSDYFGVDYWDVIKFDIEGSEIEVLRWLQRPPARQLSIEFHMHIGTPAQQIIEVFQHLQSMGYERVFDDFSRKHGLPENHWDVLFVHRIDDLVNQLKRPVGNYK